MARWDKLQSRGKVTDRRALGATGAGGLGLVGVVGILLFSILSGGEVNVEQILTELNNVQVSQNTNVDSSEFEGKDDYEVFASTVIGSNNDLWKSVFEQSGKTYVEPELVLFRSATQSGCGTATSQIGPHYCPSDQTIYIDETFYDELTKRFGATGGDVAEAYVMSHEVGHHVQYLLGTMDAVQRSNDNQQAINLELQADCFAGLWAYSIKDLGVFNEGEIKEAIDAAAAVGDDRIQSKTTGQVNPETWTHGSSEQRVEWFTKGFSQGSVSSCKIF